MLSNPEMMRSLIKSNPETTEMIKQHPEIEAALSDPNMVKSLMSPDMLKSASGMIERMQSLPKNTTMSGAPGSFPMPGSPDKKEPRKEEKKQTPQSAFGANPWGMNPFAQMMGMNTMGFSPFGYPAPSTVPIASNTGTAAERGGEEEDRAKYRSMLEEMRAMGFTDEEENLRALRVTKGDVFEAVEIVAAKSKPL
eukprot:TRINITY_DN7799_c0_g1_i8.p2 TRINITY_DN7799_c0_g1~~TRINITY_DN7799_c0_g1_i8.p2  ORF type:complete len:195 (-),score=60.95 TRINITY_DN7799_c0_g1_i8:160-744(-)